MGNVVLVTGANRGIGLEIVRQLCKLNLQVILASRDVTNGEAAMAKLESENLRPTMVQLDVTREESIVDAVATIKSRFGRLNVLINNAAVLFKQDRSLIHNASEVTASTLQADALAPLSVARAFLPLMNSGDRIINVSSGGGSMTDPVGGWSPAYCVSKSLLNAITRHLAYELNDRGILVNAMCPGWVKTDMGGKSAPRSVEQGADTAVWLATASRISTGKFYRDRKEIPW